MSKYKYKKDKKIRRIDSLLSHLSHLEHTTYPYTRGTTYLNIPLSLSMCMSLLCDPNETTETIEINPCNIKICENRVGETTLFQLIQLNG